MGSANPGSSTVAQFQLQKSNRSPRVHEASSTHGIDMSKAVGGGGDETGGNVGVGRYRSMRVVVAVEVRVEEVRSSGTSVVKVGVVLGVDVRMPGVDIGVGDRVGAETVVGGSVGRCGGCGGGDVGTRARMRLPPPHAQHMSAARKSRSS